LDYRFGRQLALTHKALQAVFDARLQRAGGSISTWVVLEHALESGALSQSLLAQRIAIEGPTLVRHLDRLEAEGLVQRRRDDADRRVVRVVVTPAGRALHERLATIADRMEADIASVLGGRQLATIKAALTRLHEWTIAHDAEEVGA
jgi:MarR family transcriptional regulator for hemolysin